MSSEQIFEQAKKLSVAERILLVEDIWDSIAADKETIELTQSQKDELDRRSEWFDKNPSKGKTWEEIKADKRQSEPNPEP
ncbi:MAG: addiction module protein [Ignavibacteriae bacterium]|nr:addiction module protein [Ignavibacteriota bacterium]